MVRNINIGDIVYFWSAHHILNEARVVDVIELGLGDNSWNIKIEYRTSYGLLTEQITFTDCVYATKEDALNMLIEFVPLTENTNRDETTNLGKD